jgi:hypothetical protein
MVIVVTGAGAAAAEERAAPFNVEVMNDGAVNVDIGGVRCVADLRILLPAFDWHGGTQPTDCARQTLAPGHVRVTGKLTDGPPCAEFVLDSQQEVAGLNLSWEVTFLRDYDAETLRLNSLLAIPLSAGQGAWYIRHPKGLRWGRFPTAYSESTANFRDWDFDWFGWLLSGGRGVRFRPRGGLRDLYWQDGRQWGGHEFQTCWTLVSRGTIRQGTHFRCTLRVEPLTADEVLREADRFHTPLFTAEGFLDPAGTAGVKGRVSAWNGRPAHERLEVLWRVLDDLGGVLASGQQTVEAPSLGTVDLPLSAPVSPSGDYRLTTEVWGPEGAVQTMRCRRMVPPPGPRQSLCLDGTWELAPADQELEAPPTSGWKPVTVPSSFEGRDHNYYWYRRSFDVPASLAGKRLKLSFGAVNHAARVWVSGHFVGRHFGGHLPFTLDVTDLAHPGQTNDLWVAVTNWTAACTNPPPNVTLGPFEHPATKLPPESIIAPIGGAFLLTGIWQSVHLLALEPLHIEDVFVQTSVRRHTIRALVTVRNEDTAAHTVTVSADVRDRAACSGPLLPPATVTVPAGEARQVTLAARWPQPHLWSLDDPYLYRLVTTLTADGRVVDHLATRFGFREVWTEGPHFVLNGVPMKLFATSAWSMETWEAACAHVARMKRAGTRCMRLHTQPWQEHILDAADELGLLIVDEAAVYCYTGAYATGDRRFWLNYADHLRGLAQRDRNHPSLALYSLENEILSCGGDPQQWEAPLGRLADIVREVDPTRLIFCESDLDPAGKMDLIGMHYPREYWEGHTLYPDKCWWLGQPGKYRWSDFAWHRQKPLYIGEFDGGFPAWYPQYQAFWLGDEAYTSRGNFSAASPNSRARREMIATEVEAYRYFDVCGLNPWFDPDEIDVFGPQAYAPLALAIRERTHDFYAGDPIPRTVFIYNDSFASARLTLRWRANVPGTPDQVGSATSTLAPCTVATWRLRLHAPRVSRRTALRLWLTLLRGDQAVFRTSRTLSVFPRLTSILAPPGLFLYDPAGRTAPALTHAGLRAQPCSDLGAIPSPAKVLLIGAGALESGSALRTLHSALCTPSNVPWARALADFVAAGGAVVCLEQEDYPAAWLPVDTELSPDVSHNIVFPCALNGPALAHLSAEDLRFWQPDHRVVRRSLLKPTRGNFRPLIDAGAILGSIHDQNGLNWAPLLELPYGRGRYLLSQLLLVERAGVEPVAALLLRNLVQYAASVPDHVPMRVALLADPDSSLKRALDGLGLEYDSLLGSLDAPTLAAYRVLIAGGGPAVWATARAHALEIRAWLERGGSLWLNNLRPEQADLLTALVNVPCELRPAEVTLLCLAQPDPLTAGLSNHELYWRDRPVWDMMTPLRRIIDFDPVVNAPGVVRLTDPPTLLKVPVGRGCVLLNQLLWDSTEGNRREGQKIASILLTNLGASLDLSPFQPVRVEDFQPIDLRPYCNLGFAGDPAPEGWMGHGPQALAGFPTGRQILARVPFDLIDPVANAGKSVLALRGAARPDYPAEVLGLSLGVQARALHFLHTCAWGRPEAALAATYVIHYADGSEQHVPLRVGVEIADWYVAPVALPAAQVAWRGYITDKPGPIGVYAMRWVNPYPEKTIASLDFLSAQGEPVPVLMALTAEK